MFSTTRSLAAVTTKPGVVAPAAIVTLAGTPLTSSVAAVPANTVRGLVTAADDAALRRTVTVTLAPSRTRETARPKATVGPAGGQALVVAVTAVDAAPQSAV
ncbi:MAG: hypothetical protein OXG64_07320 [Chloroflexi bacterium]|nr:hypothetical protein [Chloroflexota bacterium]